MKKVSAKTIENDFVSMASMRSWINPEDIGNMCAYLISDEANKVSGQVIAVDGNCERMDWSQKLKSLLWVMVFYLCFFNFSFCLVSSGVSVVAPISVMILIAFSTNCAFEAKFEKVSAKTIENDFVSMASMRSWINPEDIGNMCAYLISDEANKVSGQVIAVDGNCERMDWFTLTYFQIFFSFSAN